MFNVQCSKFNVQSSMFKVPLDPIGGAFIAKRRKNVQSSPKPVTLIIITPLPHIYCPHPLFPYPLTPDENFFMTRCRSNKWQSQAPSRGVPPPRVRPQNTHRCDYNGRTLRYAPTAFSAHRPSSLFPLCPPSPL